MNTGGRRPAGILIVVVAILVIPLMGMVRSNPADSTRPTPEPPTATPTPTATPGRTYPTPTPTPGGHDPGGECGETSTPGLVVSASSSPQLNGLSLYVRIATTADGNPYGRIRFTFEGRSLNSMEIHRVFLRGGHDQEGLAESHDGTLSVGIRGLGVLDNGEEVRVHVDLWEQRDAQDNVARVRWRPLSEEPHGVVNPLISAQQEQCPGEEGWHSTGWKQIDSVDIRQK